MGTRERKERERDERRELILRAATEIMKEEGIDNLSIRKIARRIEYSPAIIYHYFNDKGDIINHLMRKGYQKIIDGLSSVEATTSEPRQKLANLLRKFIEIALQMPDEYKTVQLSTSSEVVEHTSWLFKGASSKKPALRILFQCLREIYRDKDLDDNIIELQAQMIATIVFGLIIRLIIEENLLSAERKTELIEHHIKVIVNGVTCLT